jgi:hypothetical protein
MNDDINIDNKVKYHELNWFNNNDIIIINYNMLKNI